MENASKALIIAGAILLSILLISLGIMVYNQAIGVTDSDTLDEVSVTTHNNKFTQYEGTSVSATEVKALINAVDQNNVTYPLTTDYKHISYTSTTGYISTTLAVDTAKKYTVTFTKDSSSGYIETVSIKAN